MFLFGIPNAKYDDDERENARSDASMSCLKNRISHCYDQNQSQERPANYKGEHEGEAVRADDKQ